MTTNTVASKTDPAHTSDSSVMGRKDIQTELKYHTSEDIGKPLVVNLQGPNAGESMKNLATRKRFYPVTVQDIRGEETQFTLDRNGFQYIWDPIPEIDDWTNEEKCKAILVPKAEQLVQKLAVTSKIFTAAVTVRSLSADTRLYEDNRSPAFVVHSDFSHEGAARFLASKFDSIEAQQLMQTHRIIALNLWRPLQTITKDPFAVCDTSSVDYSRDYSKLRFQLPNDQWQEAITFFFNDRHQWHYLHRQQPEELLIFKQYDSDAEVGPGGVPHSAFIDPDFVENEARRSIEIRIFAAIPKNESA